MSTATGKKVRIDLTSQKFGRLTVKEFSSIDKHRACRWRCICACGSEKIISSASLRSGNTQSCGCLKRERASEARKSMIDLARELRACQKQLDEFRKDAERYRWLRDAKCNALHFSHDDEQSINYVSAKEWIEDYVPERYEDVPAEELQRMKDMNSIWSLQVYPDSPVGFWLIYGATADSVIDQAIEAEEK